MNIRLMLYRIAKQEALDIAIKAASDRSNSYLPSDGEYSTWRTIKERSSRRYQEPGIFIHEGSTPTNPCSEIRMGDIRGTTLNHMTVDEAARMPADYADGVMRSYQRGSETMSDTYIRIVASDRERQEHFDRLNSTRAIERAAVASEMQRREYAQRDVRMTASMDMSTMNPTLMSNHDMSPADWDRFRRDYESTFDQG